MNLHAGGQPFRAAEERDKRRVPTVAEFVASHQNDFSVYPFPELIHVSGFRRILEIGERDAREGAGWSGVVDRDAPVRCDGDAVALKNELAILPLGVASGELL